MPTPGFEIALELKKSFVDLKKSVAKLNTIAKYRKHCVPNKSYSTSAGTFLDLALLNYLIII